MFQYRSSKRGIAGGTRATVICIFPHPNQLDQDEFSPWKLNWGLLLSLHLFRPVHPFATHRRQGRSAGSQSEAVADAADFSYSHRRPSALLWQIADMNCRY